MQNLSPRFKIQQATNVLVFVLFSISKVFLMGQRKSGFLKVKMLEGMTLQI